MSEVLAPTNGYRGSLEKAGKKVKDHASANIQNMRDAQRMNRERRIIDASTAQKPFKLKEFAEVPSQVHKRVNDQQAAFKARQEARENGEENGSGDKKFLRKGAREDRATERKNETAATARSGKSNEGRQKTRKDLLPMEVLQPRPITPEDRPLRNFQKENSEKIRVARKAQAAPVDKHKPTNYGKVPKYLRERQAELASDEQERIRLANLDVDCPPGMRLLPENERQTMLKTLERNREKVVSEISKLPFVIDTMGLKKRKQGLESKIKEIDDAVRIFSRKKVKILHFELSLEVLLLLVGVRRGMISRRQYNGEI